MYNENFRQNFDLGVVKRTLQKIKVNKIKEKKKRLDKF